MLRKHMSLGLSICENKRKIGCGTAFRCGLRESSKSHISGLGVFIHQCSVYRLHFLKVRKTSSSVVHPLSNLKYV